MSTKEPANLRIPVEAAELKTFDVSPTRGFLPDEDPLRELPAAWRNWEAIARELPHLLLAGRVRPVLDAMTAVEPAALEDDRQLRRAMLLLSYFGHAYVWGDREAVQSIPASIAVPWAHVAARLGRPPVLSYASYALDNWRRIDRSGPVELGNIALLQNFLGGADEDWFILVHVDIEAKAAPAIAALGPAQQAAANGDALRLESALCQIADALEAVNHTLARMSEWCDPHTYYRRVRPYIHGWKNNPALPDGLVYEGVEAFAGLPQQMRGETGAQSSIVPCLDAVLGIAHRSDPLREYLLEMRDYMPPAHRRLLTAFEGVSSVRQCVEANGSRAPALAEAYDSCLQWIERMRTVHLEYASEYINKQASAGKTNPTDVGTGGTPFMPYLTKHRDETAAQRLHLETPKKR